MEPITTAIALGSLAVSVWGAFQQSEANDSYAQELRAAAAKNDQAAKDELALREKIVSKLESEWDNPEYASTQFTPQEIQYLGDFMPQISQVVQEKNPELIKGLTSATEKGYQRQALSQLSGETTAKPITVQDTIQQKMKLAQQQASAAESAQRATMLRDLASRGLLGGGQEALLAAQAQQGQARGMEQAGMQAGIESAKEVEAAKRAEDARRMNAMSALGSLSTQARGQELGIEEGNVSAINAFNQRASTRLQQHLNNQADVQNTAALRNLKAKQDTANQNVEAKNTASQYNINRDDRITESLAGAKNRRLQAITSAMSGVANTTATQNASTLESDQRLAKANSGSIIGDIAVNAPALVKGGADLYKSINTADSTGDGDLTDDDKLAIANIRKAAKFNKGLGV